MVMARIDIYFDSDSRAVSGQLVGLIVIFL